MSLGLHDCKACGGFMPVIFKDVWRCEGCKNIVLREKGCKWVRFVKGGPDQ